MDSTRAYDRINRIHSPQRFAASLLATSATHSEHCLLASSRSTDAARPAQRNNSKGRHNMFGPRRGYDAIGEPSVSNADKPRVQPVKVDPKVL